MGVFAPLVGIVGATQAAEALKLIAGVGTSLAGRLLLLDALAMQWRELARAARPGVPGVREASDPHETLHGSSARGVAASSRLDRCARWPLAAPPGARADAAADRTGTRSGR